MKRTKAQIRDDNNLVLALEYKEAKKAYFAAIEKCEAAGLRISAAYSGIYIYRADKRGRLHTVIDEPKATMKEYRRDYGTTLF